MGAGAAVFASSPPWPIALLGHSHDAIHAAAAYLCDSGAPDDLYAAIYAYNHADWYVRKVLAQAEDYRAAATVAPAPQEGGWVVPAQGTCTSGFGPRNGEMHNGLDVSAPTGTPKGSACGDVAGRS